MKKAEIEARRQQIAALALREFQARCRHCKIALSKTVAIQALLASSKGMYCSQDCLDAAEEVAQQVASVGRQETQAGETFGAKAGHQPPTDATNREDR